MTKIITLTLSPAFDVHCYCKDFEPYHENLATITSREAGGKGVNISRALKKNGVDSLAVIALGDENAADFEGMLRVDGITYQTVLRSGRIRENMTLHTEGAPETRISFSGFSADVSLLSDAEAILDGYFADGDAPIVTFTGRVPDGIPMDAVKAFLSRLSKRGARIVIDSKSFTVGDILALSPYLIKPNEEEIGAYAEKAVENEADAAQVALSLRERGIENVMISLGSRGALLACRDGVLFARPPKIEALSTIGAGDSSIAGFLSALVGGEENFEKCLTTAVAYGTAACLTAGTLPPERDDVERILPQVTLERIG